MISNKPYLLRALNEWIVDNGFTPHILVNADCEDVNVPADYIEDGKIVLNISPGATRDLAISNDYVIFSARFNGTARTIEVPVQSIVAIYARENGKGMLFSGDEDAISDSSTTQTTGPAKPHLKIVK